MDAIERELDEGEAPTWLELNSGVSLPKGAKIAGVSPEALKEHYGAYINQIGERRFTILLKHALGIANGTIKPAKQTEPT
jgi:hypothetical protein